MLNFRSRIITQQLAPLECQGKTMIKAKDIAKCKTRFGGGQQAIEQNHPPACKAIIGRLARKELNHYEQPERSLLSKKTWCRSESTNRLNSILAN